MASISNSVHLDCSWETSYSQPFVPTWSAMLHVPQGNAAGQCYHLFFFFFFFFLYDVFPEPVSLMSRYLPHHSQSIVSVQSKVTGLKLSRQHGQGIAAKRCDLCLAEKLAFSTAWPGHSSEEMRPLLAEKLENQL